MGTDIYGISVSALNTAQMGLATTEHNIANANTAGYTRQVVGQTARPAQNSGAGYIGQGSDVGTITRVYDEFLSAQVVQEQVKSAQLNTYYTKIQQINNMLADPNAGMSPALQDFFGAVSSVSSAPDSIPARQTLLSTAQTLTARFQSMNQRLVDINDSVNGQIAASVTTINSYAIQIATLNQNVVMATAQANGKPPNDLLDQRDQLVAQLNQEVKTNVVKQQDGSLNIFVGNGQSLVVGAHAYSLLAVNTLNDPSKLEVAYGSAGGETVRMQQSGIQGGNLGGILNFRSQSLDGAQNSLGLVAMGLAGTFNQQHKLGQDLNGVLGGNFFVQPVPVVNKNLNNIGTAVPTVSVSDYSKLTGSDYALSYDGASYTLTRLLDNTTTNFAASPQTVDGLTITVPVAPAPSAGDSFMIRPTMNGALNIAVAITDTAKIAAAAPIRAASGSVVGGVLIDNNTGTGEISAGVVDATYTAATAALLPVALTYDSATNTLSGFPAALPVTVTNNGVATPGSPFAAGAPVTYTDGATISFGGISFTLTGAPDNNDIFTIERNTNATSDNRNALLLGVLQTKTTMLGGTASYQGVYGQLVSQVGNKTRELQVTSTAQDTMLQQTIQAQQSVSGVNLDEEAANLLRYQRAYQAAGKAMQIASTLFDTLLSLGR